MPLTVAPVQQTGVLAPLGRDDGEAGARASLRRQIASLEVDTAQLIAEAFPKVLDLPDVASGPARLLNLGALERLRDQLAERVEAGRRQLSLIRQQEEEARGLVEQMLADPGAYRWLRVSREEAGLAGCGHWHVRPRLGLVGMLMGWWRVKISSGCP